MSDKALLLSDLREVKRKLDGQAFEHGPIEFYWSPPSEYARTNHPDLVAKYGEPYDPTRHTERNRLPLNSEDPT